MSISITNSINNSSTISIADAITTLDSLLADAKAGCSQAFAVRVVRNTIGGIDGLKHAFMSELTDALQDGCVISLCSDGIDALARLRELLKEYKHAGWKNDYCDHQLTVLAEYIATVAR